MLTCMTRWQLQALVNHLWYVDTFQKHGGWISPENLHRVAFACLDSWSCILPELGVLEE